MINRSKSGEWIWKNKVMNSSLKRSPKLKTATINRLISTQTTINGIQVQATGMTYPVRETKKYLVRLSKGFTKNFKFCLRVIKFLIKMFSA